MKYYASINGGILEADSIRPIYNAIRRDARCYEREYTTTVFTGESLEDENREQIGTFSIKKLNLAGTDSILMAIEFWGDDGKLHYTTYTANGIYAVA